MTNYSECELTELSVYSDYCSDDYEVMASGMSKSIPHVGINDSLLLYCVVVTIIGYEPADLTVHPPPQNDRGWVHFFRTGV